MKTSLKFIIILAFSSLAFYTIDKENVKVIRVTSSSAAGELSSLIKSYEIIPLDDNPEAYIKNPLREIFSDSLILIHDGFAQKIVIFNKSGKYINSISKKGRAPNEYLYITDFSFNPTDRLVSVIDRDKIKRYNLNGEFLDETKVAFQLGKMTKISPDLTILEKVIPSEDQSSNFYIRLIDQNFKTIDARFPIKPLNGPGFGTEGQNFRTIINGDHAFFFSFFGDTVYHIDQKAIKPVYSFNYDKKIITVTNGTGQYDTDPDQALRYLSFFEIKDLNLLFYTFKKKGYCFAFNSTNTKSRLYESSFSIRDVFEGKGIILYDSMYLGKLIEKIDPAKSKCINKVILGRILQKTEDASQTIIKIDFSNL